VVSCVKSDRLLPDDNPSPGEDRQQCLTRQQLLSDKVICSDLNGADTASVDGKHEVNPKEAEKRDFFEVNQVGLLKKKPDRFFGRRVSTKPG
jgi:hypothetical protein